MGGAGGLAAAAGEAVSRLGGALASASAAPSGAAAGSLGEWAATLAELQRVVDVASAAQELVVARVAAVELGYAEDGTVVERYRGPGHVSVDAAGVVSGVLGCTAVHAEAWVRSAVRRAADGPPGTGWHTGLGGLHAAMAAGRVDRYRADVVAAELDEAPAPVAAGVVAAVEPWFGVETGPQLRRRVRRMLARVSPDLVRQRARRARAESRLERWAGEPGVDTWHGTFPSEEAAVAWAAVDALAQRYVDDGTCERVDRARAKALTDLVTGNATVEVAVVLTVPQDPTGPDGPEVGPADDTHGEQSGDTPGFPRPGSAEVAPPHPQDLVEVPGLRPSEPLLVPRGWLRALTRQAADAAAAPAASRRDRRRLRVRSCHPDTGAALTDHDTALTGHGAVSTGPGDDRHGGSGAVPSGSAPSRSGPPGPGPGPSGSSPSGSGPPGSGGYRPARALAELVRARDGHCRFPGCHVAARFCDLDHVRPWPVAPTTAANLLCLCRRHHRVKQRPRWSVRLHPDGTASWTDPTGLVRSTDPLDTLHPLVLPHRAGEPPATPGTPRLDLPEAPHSALEYALEHRLAAVGARADPSRRAHAPRDSLPDDPPF